MKICLSPLVKGKKHPRSSDAQLKIFFLYGRKSAVLNSSLVHDFLISYGSYLDKGVSGSLKLEKVLGQQLGSFARARTKNTKWIKLLIFSKTKK
jgi:hypothetical protein